MKTEVVELPLTRIAGIRHKGPYDEIGQVFGQLGPKAGKLGLFGQPDAHMVALYIDEPGSKPVDELDSVAGVVVPETTPIGDLEEFNVPGGKFFKAEFIGGYNKLGEAWNEVVSKLVPQSGNHLRNGVSFEMYMSDMQTTPPDKMRTDIYVPLA